MVTLHVYIKGNGMSDPMLRIGHAVICNGKSVSRMRES